MLNNFYIKISQNKNSLMLFSTGIYILALLGVLSSHALLISTLISSFFIYSLLKNLFPIKYIIVWTLLFYLGIINISVRLKDTDELLNLTPVNSEITGTIISIPQGIVEGKPKFFFKVDKIKFNNIEKELKNEKVMVTMSSDDSNLGLYKSGILQGRLSAPFRASNPSQFDYSNYLRNHNTYSVFYAKTFTPIEKELSLKAKVMQKINNHREHLISLHSKYLKSPNLEILGGIVFGDDAVSPPKTIKNSFANSGLLHILAASGMNVAFIYGFFFSILSLFKVNFKINVILGMIMVSIYSLMTGLGASIIRATFMLLFVLIGKLIDRDANSISLLSFVGLLMLIYNPLFINDIGFQLSFIVTFGILTMSPIIIRFKNKILDFIAGTIAIPIIAQLWVIPVQIFYFSNISLYSVFANIMSVPILMIISFSGFISSLLASITPFSDFICKVFDFIINPVITILVNISDFWGHLPNSVIKTTHPTPFQIIIYYIILLSITGIFYKEIRAKNLKTLIISSLIFIFIWLITLIPIKNSCLEILTFDVGNADCFLIKTPKNEYILVDSGKAGYNGGKSQAETIVLKYMLDKGIKNISTIVITHFDNDHCGGVVDIINSVKVNEVYVNDLNHSSIMANQIYKTALKNNTKVILATNKQEVYNKNQLSLINFIGKPSSDDNENSIITLLKYRKFNMLFTGDASIKSIKDVLAQIPKDINILKIPHHGAIGGIDKEILSHLNPQISIISVGENIFGHPSLYTLKLLENSKILRTDIDNSIKIKVSKKNFRIYTYDTKKRKYVLDSSYSLISKKEKPSNEG